MASVGLTEQQATDRGLSVNINRKSVPNWFNAKRLNEENYAYKTIVDKKTDKLLGAHIIGTAAEETINLFTMAMKGGVKANDIRKTIFSYPTLASDISHMV